jgi:hypothetical protein
MKCCRCGCQPEKLRPAQSTKSLTFQVVPAAIERLRKYLLRNQGAIPGSALRRQLGLRNSSSPVESANNELTARRHNGMSGSEPGSHALTALSMLVSNRCHKTWVRKQIIPLEFIDKAA